jgi:hypothetical protein
LLLSPLPRILFTTGRRYLLSEFHCFALTFDCIYIVTDKIINRIKEAGFRIISRKDVGLTKELAGQFYHEHEGKDFFNGLTDYMSRYFTKDNASDVGEVRGKVREVVIAVVKVKF